jgi:hypothetical protein
MRLHRARSFAISAILATAAILASVATVLAEGGGNPFPK